MNWRYMLSDIVLGAEEEQAVLRVIRSRWLSMGPETAALETELASTLGAPRALAVSNCTASLHLALRALGIGPGDEVIVPSLSFVATAGAVVHAGAEPVFAEIESLERPHLSAATIDARITPRTRAVIVMHYGGYPCDMDPILDLAARRGLKIVEDTAHAAGSRYKGRACGTIGDAGCFSFFGNKNVAAGEGGALIARDPAVQDKARALRSHGMTTLSWDRASGHAITYEVTEIGFNYRMPELSAAVARAQLKRLPSGNATRDSVHEAYAAALAPHRSEGWILACSQLPPPGARHLVAALAPPGADRMELMNRLKAAGIQSSIHYPPIHLFEAYRKRSGAKAVSLPVTEEFSNRVLTLPFHAGLSASDATSITQALLKAAEGPPKGQKIRGS